MIRVAVLIVCAALGLATEAAELKPYVPKQETVDGNELAFVYISATNCGFCRAPGIKAAVLQAKSILAARAAAERRPFSATGVALDYDIEAGLAFLKDVGPFDEVILGRDWNNSAVLDLLSNGGEDVVLGIPQVVVYERMISRRGYTMSTGRPHVLARIPGTGIPLWVKAGATLEGD